MHLVGFLLTMNYDARNRDLEKKHNKCQVRLNLLLGMIYSTTKN